MRGPALTSGDHCISVSPCERRFLWTMTSLRRRRLWPLPPAKNLARSFRSWPGAACEAKEKPPAKVVCRFSKCRPMLRLSRAIGPESCSLTTRRETGPARYKRPARARLAKSSTPRRGPSLVSRRIQKRMGDLCAHATRIRPSFRQPRLHASSRSSAAGSRAVERTVDSQTASLLAFAGRQEPCDLSSGSRPSAGKRCLSRRPRATTARPSGHARFQAPDPRRGRSVSVCHCLLIGSEDRK